MPRTVSISTCPPLTAASFLRRLLTWTSTLRS